MPHSGAPTWHAGSRQPDAGDVLCVSIYVTFEMVDPITIAAATSGWGRVPPRRNMRELSGGMGVSYIKLGCG